jgi:hypothetical protein
MSGLLWLNTPASAAALIIVFLLSILLLLANSALLPYGGDRQERTKRFIWLDNYVLFIGVLAFIMMLAEGSHRLRSPLLWFLSSPPSRKTDKSFISIF